MSDKKQFEEGHLPSPSQEQPPPGFEYKMQPTPLYNKFPSGNPSGDSTPYLPASKLKDYRAFITGGDSGIGRSAAVLFAMEGADIAITYLKEEEKDAQETKRLVEGYGRKCFIYEADLSKREVCKEVTERAVGDLGGLDVLVNNCAYQKPAENIEDLSDEQWDHTFKTNIYSYFHISKHAMPHLRKSHTASIINIASVNHYIGRPDLLDYTTTKGAIVAFTRALSNQVVGDGIRVNAVAPGPIWTPLVVWSFPPEKREEFGVSTKMKRPGQPSEVGSCCVFLASRDSSYMSGQTLHPNGGEVVNG